MRGASDRSASPYAAALCADRVPPKQRHPECLDHGTQSGEEALVCFTQHMRNQHAGRRSALRGQVGQVNRDQFPRDIGRILVLADMDPLDQRIVRYHQRVIAKGKDSCIVFQAAGGGILCQRLQRGDEVAFVQRPASLAIASRMPFTNLASRSSKKALATSTYSLIALALGTSGRASNS